MRRRKTLIAVGIATFLLIAIATFPARIASSWLAPEQLRLGGVTGSIWSGHASEVAFGSEYFSDVSWSLKPLHLLMASVAVDAEVNTIAGRLSVSLAAGLGSTVTVSNVRGNLSIAGIHPAFDANLISGNLEINIDEIVLDDGYPSLATGQLTVSNLVAGAMGTSPLGSFDAVLDTTDVGIMAIVSDNEAIFDLAGTLTLARDRSYLFVGDIAPTSLTPRRVSENLRFLGSPDADGKRQFRFEGSL